MNIVEEIKAQRQAVLRGNVACGVSRCPLCGGDPGAFRLHERRRRSFWVVMERLVEKVLSLLARWKCPLCGGTFTEYPGFALPHKRYVRPEVEGRARGYVPDEDATYVEAAKDKGMSVCHPIDAGTQQERHLHASTVWRWVGFLGGLKATVRRAMALVRQRAPQSAVARSAYAVPARKYRSAARRRLLQRCLQLLALHDLVQRLFGVSIFPRSATAASFT